LNTGDLAGAGGTSNAAHKTVVKARRPGEESERAIVPTKAAKTAGGKGMTSLDDVTPASKEEGLWRH
jgi:hypothetical protein